MTLYQAKHDLQIRYKAKQVNKSGFPPNRNVDQNMFAGCVPFTPFPLYIPFLRHIVYSMIIGSYIVLYLHILWKRWDMEDSSA